eukprot:Plantae.Rhodophyta-Purpureofilum_apyrenoidigerum.ctg10484.p1 GENE.Plantae.Rhodophyta-Purpureofilum_apyrenoidigerum.ctg10484~~Plantae.Rhodophyta-Purpureofilum_apyrenoidigerum.ctg10484.p1  ORF type:complete len:534 (-),score=110.43 Plantae.Rhodophyta-Purpureofilum_apyrenoidigerum.ctg10484:79-1626(-)
MRFETRGRAAVRYAGREAPYSEDPKEESRRIAPQRGGTSKASTGSDMTGVSVEEHTQTTSLIWESSGNLDLLRRHSKRKAGKVKRTRMLAKCEDVDVELRGGNLLTSGSDGTQVLPLQNALIVAEGRRFLLIKQGNMFSRLVFKSRSEREAWKVALREQTKVQRPRKLSDFTVITKLGEGGSGRVFLVRDEVSGENLAMKVLSKGEKSTYSLQRVIDERMLLETLDHPFIIKLKYAFQTKGHLFLLTDYCEGGDLQSFIKRRRFLLKESVVKRIVAEVLLALSYVHASGAIYRDIKPDNILLDARGHAKLADFGLARMLPEGREGRAYSICGTKKFMSPEILFRKGYNQRVDIWSLGILMYALLEGYPPFETFPSAKVLSHCALPFKSQVSDAARSAIYSMLTFDPAERPTAEDVMKLPFFAGVNFDELLLQQEDLSELTFDAWERNKIASGEVMRPQNPVDQEFSIESLTDDNDSLFAKFFRRKSMGSYVPGFSFWSDCSVESMKLRSEDSREL